ncbi:MAG TPA: response regulator [Methylomirabilota bacterium]|nr:response regulator [Methylomirabilota bacterium]
MNEKTSTILVIEDHEDVAALAAYFLRRANYQPVVARDGLEGLRLARTLSPALILCDACLPSLNGSELLVLLRADPATARVPFVLMSGYEIARCSSPMPDAFLGKPFRSEDLLALVRAHIPRLRCAPSRQSNAAPVLETALSQF